MSREWTPLGRMTWLLIVVLMALGLAVGLSLLTGCARFERVEYEWHPVVSDMVEKERTEIYFFFSKTNFKNLDVQTSDGAIVKIGEGGSTADPAVEAFRAGAEVFEKGLARGAAEAVGTQILPPMDTN